MNKLSLEYAKIGVIRYYEETLDDYRFFWYTQKDLAMHYGFADETTKSHSERLLNENRFLADIAEIRSSDYVLDAGCGVGGSSIWIANNYRAKVVGISISPSQIKQAKIYSNNRKVSNLTKFYTMDYHKTKFKDSQFDVIWAIESVSSSTDKQRMLKEFFRILKPKGRLVIADGFQIKKIKNSKDQKLLDKFMRGLAVYKTQLCDQFKEHLGNAGFRNIKIWDKTKEIIPSAKRIYYMGLFTYPFWKILNKIKFVSNVRHDNAMACIAQWKSLKKGLWKYCVYYAEK